MVIVLGVLLPALSFAVMSTLFSPATRPFTFTVYSLPVPATTVSLAVPIFTITESRYVSSTQATITSTAVALTDIVSADGYTGVITGALLSTTGGTYLTDTVLIVFFPHLS